MLNIDMYGNAVCSITFYCLFEVLSTGKLSGLPFKSYYGSIYAIASVLILAYLSGISPIHVPRVHLSLLTPQTESGGRLRSDSVGEAIS